MTKSADARKTLWLTLSQNRVKGLALGIRTHLVEEDMCMRGDPCNETSLASVAIASFLRLWFRLSQF
jgi:CRISPR/Cas system CMR-associated protein Cmr1 (group 7 of RAMP superfamily)